MSTARNQEDAYEKLCYISEFKTSTSTSIQDIDSVFNCDKQWFPCWCLSVHLDMITVAQKCKGIVLLLLRLFSKTGIHIHYTYS